MKWFLLLIPQVALAPLLASYGLGGGPIIGLDFYLPADLGDLKALARVGLRVSVEGGNLFFETSNWEDVSEVFYLDSENVSVSYGYLRSRLPVVVFPRPGDWVFRIGGGYVIFSDGIEIVSDTGKTVYGVSRSGWWIGLRLTDGALLVYDSRYGFGGAMDFGKIVVGFMKGLFLKLNTENLDVSVRISENGRELVIGYFQDDEYLFLNERGVEFVKKVGSVYVTGEVQKGKFEVSVEYPAEF